MYTYIIALYSTYMFRCLSIIFYLKNTVTLYDTRHMIRITYMYIYVSIPSTQLTSAGFSKGSKRHVAAVHAGRIRCYFK